VPSAHFGGGAPRYSLEIEPGRYYVAPACTLITQVHDVKQTQTN
jgi:diaminopimelate decarboxylase